MEPSFARSGQWEILTWNCAPKGIPRNSVPAASLKARQTMVEATMGGFSAFCTKISNPASMADIELVMRTFFKNLKRRCKGKSYNCLLE